jgi:hypothetical protein
VLGSKLEVFRVDAQLDDESVSGMKLDDEWTLPRVARQCTGPEIGVAYTERLRRVRARDRQHHREHRKHEERRRGMRTAIRER